MRQNEYCVYSSSYVEAKRKAIEERKERKAQNELKSAKVQVVSAADWFSSADIRRQQAEEDEQEAAEADQEDARG